MFRLSRRRLLGLTLAAPMIGIATATATRTEAAVHILAGTPPASPDASCAGTPAASPAASPGASPTSAVSVKMVKGLRFDPDHVTIKVGQTIKWTNEGAVPHTTTCDQSANPVSKAHPEYVQLPPGAKPWNSGFLNPGQSFSHTFTVPGEYKYICIPHVLSGMRASITVEC